MLHPEEQSGADDRRLRSDHRPQRPGGAGTAGAKDVRRDCVRRRDAGHGRHDHGAAHPSVPSPAGHHLHHGTDDGTRRHQRLPIGRGLLHQEAFPARRAECPYPGRAENETECTRPANRRCSRGRRICHRQLPFPALATPALLRRRTPGTDAQRSADTRNALPPEGTGGPARRHPDRRMGNGRLLLLAQPGRLHHQAPQIPIPRPRRHAQVAERCWCLPGRLSLIALPRSTA